MDTKKVALAIASTGITAASIAAAFFLWNQPVSEDQVQTAQEGTVANIKNPPSEPKDTGAIITDIERTKEQPTAQEKPENAVRVSLPDPSDTLPDRSAEKFDSDADEDEDTDDGITIETEPDDE